MIHQLVKAIGRMRIQDSMLSPKQSFASLYFRNLYESEPEVTYSIYLSVRKNRGRPGKEERVRERRRLFHTHPSSAPKTVFRKEIGIRKDNLILTSEPLNLSVFKHTKKGLFPILVQCRSMGATLLHTIIQELKLLPSSSSITY